MNSISISKSLSLPKWVKEKINDKIVLQNNSDKMQFVINLAEENVINKTGGPFAAAVFNKVTGELVSVGVNMVLLENCSAAHAEIIALILAEENLNQHRLNGEYVLVSSAQPCAMCNGALLWSGIKTLIYGAAKEDVESIAGFDEGPVPENWKEELKKRGIDIIEKVNHDIACDVLRLYTDSDGELY